MARTATARRSASPVNRPGSTIVVRSGGSAARRSARGGARRGGVPARLARAAIDQRHTLIALGTAAGLGYAKREGWEIPAIGGLGPAATIGLAAWAVGQFSGSVTAKHVATGALAIALHDWAAYDQTTRDQIEGLLDQQRARNDADGAAPVASNTSGWAY